MDAGGSAVPRSVRQFRSGVALSQTEAEAASARVARRRKRSYGAQGGRVLRRLVSACARRVRAGKRGAAGGAGRDPSTLSITVFNAPADKAALAAYRDAGITRVLIEVPDRGRDEVLRVLDEKASLCGGEWRMA